MAFKFKPAHQARFVLEPRPVRSSSSSARSRRTWSLRAVSGGTFARKCLSGPNSVKISAMNNSPMRPHSATLAGGHKSLNR